MLTRAGGAVFRKKLRGGPQGRGRYALRSYAKNSENNDNEVTSEVKNEVSPNDEKIWNLVTTKNTDPKTQVKIKQEIIDTATNPYEILNYDNNEKPETEVISIVDNEEECKTREGKIQSKSLK